MRKYMFTLALLCLFFSNLFAQSCFDCEKNVSCTLNQFDAPICAYAFKDKPRPEMFKSQFLNRRVDFSVTNRMLEILFANRAFPLSGVISLTFEGDANISGASNIGLNAVIPVIYATSGRKTINYSYHINGSPKLLFEPDCVPLITHCGSFDIIIKPNTGIYAIPDKIWDISTTRTWQPSYPQAYTLAEDAHYNVNDIADGLAFIRLAPGHNSIVKPLILLTGFDPNPVIIRDPAIPINNDYESQIIRYGGNGWDTFVQGADEGFVDAAAGLDYETFYGYPQQFNDFSALGFDIIVMDFKEGADYIQKNAILVEELITRVNAEKVPDTNGTLHGNIVIGASMGGAVGRMALTRMEERGDAHCTHTFATFDTPTKGANIPLGIQALGWSFYQTAEAGDNGIKSTWKWANTPAARQLLHFHLGTLVNEGTISLDYELISNSGFPGTPLTSNFTDSYNILREEFISELEELAYPKETRLVGIACGNATGVGQSFSPGSTLLDATLDATILGETYQVFRSNVLAINGAANDICIDILFDGNSNLSCDNSNNVIYQMAKPTESTNWVSYPNEWEYIKFELNSPLPLMDTAPGSGRRDILAAGELIKTVANNDESLTADVPDFPGRQQQCFVPVMSAIDADISFETGLGLNYAALVASGAIETPYDAGEIYLGSPANNKHVEIDASLNTWINGKLPVWSNFDELVLPNSNGQRYNYGQDYRLLPNITVNNGGELAINGGGGTLYDGEGPTTANYSKVNTNTIFGCIESYIDVKDGGNMVIGTQNGGRRAKATIHDGSTVHIRNGGTLRLTGSELIIEEGAKLIIEEGANIDLYWSDSRIVVKGELEINGEFNFDGNGYFDFYKDNIFSLNADAFHLTGQSMDQRFIKLNPLATLIIPSGKNLELSNGRVEMNEAVGILTKGGAIDLYNVNMDSNEGISQLGISTVHTDDVRLFNCEFNSFGSAVSINTLSPNASFDWEYVTMTNILEKGITINNANDQVLSIKNTNISVSGIVDYGIHIGNANTTYISACEIENDVQPYNSDAIGIQLRGVKQLIVGASTISGFGVGINGNVGLDKNNVSLIAGSSINVCKVGVALKGGKDVITKTGWGRLTMDCASLINNKAGVQGQDILLDIDAYMHCGCVQDDAYLQSNTFVKDNGSDDLFFDICYVQRDDIELVSASGNYWEVNGAPGANNPDYIIQYGFCGENGATDIPVDQSLEVLSMPVGCPAPPYEPGDPNPEPGTDVKSCGIEGIVIGGNIDKDGIKGSYRYSINQIENANTLLQPIATVSDAVRIASPQLCRDRIDVARTYISGADDDSRRRRQTNQIITDENLNTESYRQNISENTDKVVLIYPNPANNLITINLIKPVTKIDFFNSMGQLIYTSLPEKGLSILSIDSNQWQEGMYYVQFSCQENQQKVTKRIVILH